MKRETTSRLSPTPILRRLAVVGVILIFAAAGAVWASPDGTRVRSRERDSRHSQRKEQSAQKDRSAQHQRHGDRYNRHDSGRHDRGRYDGNGRGGWENNRRPGRQ